MTAPDHTTRAVELTEAAVAGIDIANPGLTERHILTAAANAAAKLALAEAVGRLAPRVDKPRWDDDLRAQDAHPDPVPDGTTPDADLRAWTPNMDGNPAPWNEGDCAGHSPDDHRTRWCYCRRNALRFPTAKPVLAWDHEAAMAPDGLADVERIEKQRDAFRAERDRLREGIREMAERLSTYRDLGGAAPVVTDLRALLADDETHRNPITVAGTPAEQRHREEKP